MLAQLFGRKKKEPRELVREWQSSLRKEMRGVDRQIFEIEREAKGVEKAVKDASKRGDINSARILAKEIVRSKKAVGRLYTNKAHMNSVSMHLRENLATQRAMSNISQSTEVMQLMNELVRVPEMNKAMAAMGKEMVKAGIIEELIEDSVESALDSDGIEEETEEEVQKVSYHSSLQ